WGYTMVRGDRSVDVFVRKLRQKLEKASPRWRYIHTHFGIGYRFAAESLDAPPPDAVAAGSDGQDWRPGDQRELARAHQDRELPRAARALLRAVEHGLEGRAHARERGARDPRLVFAAGGQAPFGVGGCAARLGLGVTQYPQLASHCALATLSGCACNFQPR